jgi:hypothetical protein
MRRHLLSLFFVFSIIPSAEAACLAGGTTVVYGNGVNTTWDDALNSASILQGNILAELTKYPAIDPSCIITALAHDPAPTDVTLINLAVQAGFISSRQVALQFAPQFPAWLNSPVLAPPWFVNTLGLLIPTSTNVVGSVNQAYTMLGSPDDTKFSVIGVATPADHVAGGGHYLTLFNDIITLVPFSLPANVTNPTTPGGPCSSILNLITRVTCHYFDTSYMGGFTLVQRYLATL